MNLFKRNISLGILLCLVAIPFLFSVYIITTKKIIEFRMEKRMEKECLKSVMVDPASVIWLKKNKEVLLHGEPFDVKQVRVSGSKWILIGLYDHEEKALAGKLNKLGNSGHLPNSGDDALLLIFFTIYYKPVDPVSLNCCFMPGTIKQWQKEQQMIRKCYYDIIIPPPRSC